MLETFDYTFAAKPYRAYYSGPDDVHFSLVCSRPFMFALSFRHLIFWLMSEQRSVFLQDIPALNYTQAFHSKRE
jgi:hypothetical protein